MTQKVNANFQLTFDGWLAVTDTWTRTGNYTFTISGDVTATYRKGSKVRYKDGGSYEYGVIASSSFAVATTTVTLITNSDYAMAAATITDTYISFVGNPEGFPNWFNWAPVTTGFSADPTSAVYMWTTYAGNTCRIHVRQGGNGTSNANTFQLTLPVVAKTITNEQWQAAAVVTVDNSVILTTPGMAVIPSASTTVDCYKDVAAAVWTTSGGKRMNFMLDYQF